MIDGLNANNELKKLAKLDVRFFESREMRTDADDALKRLRPHRGESST